ncbi:ATP-binding protein [Streptomyces sp. NPDC055299]
MLRNYEVDPGPRQPRRILPAACLPSAPSSSGDISAERRAGCIDEQTEHRFNRAAKSVGKARAFVLAALPVDQLRHRIDDITLCVSELVTNAVRHGSPAGHLILVRVIVNEMLLRIEVHDAGENRPWLQSPADDDLSGRGLFLVDAFADDWGITPRDGLGKVVWVEFKVPAPVAVHVPCLADLP